MGTFRILNVGYPFARVGLDAAGGAEQILLSLDRALCAAGHESFVLAPQGSRVHGTLSTLPLPEGNPTRAARSSLWSAYRRTIAELVARRRIDLVHWHGVDFFEYLPELSVPRLSTLHLPPDWYPPAVFEQSRLTLTCVSASQRRLCPASATISAVIENGVDLARLTPAAHDFDPARAYALSLGRVCPEKGYHLAFDAARAAGVPLLLGGAVYPYPDHRRYLRRQILPRQDAYRRFIGPVGFVEKRRLLQRARCLVVPSLVPETSSLVVMEAFACGTPVVAMRKGALPDLIDHGLTGFVVDDRRSMAAAIRDSVQLSRAACREAAVRQFDERYMAAHYLELYARLIDSSQRSTLGLRSAS